MLTHFLFRFLHYSILSNFYEVYQNYSELYQNVIRLVYWNLVHISLKLNQSHMGLIPHTYYNTDYLCIALQCEQTYIYHIR